MSVFSCMYIYVSLYVLNKDQSINQSMRLEEIVASLFLESCRRTNFPLASLYTSGKKIGEYRERGKSKGK